MGYKKNKFPKPRKMRVILSPIVPPRHTTVEQIRDAVNSVIKRRKKKKDS